MAKHRQFAILLEVLEQTKPLQNDPEWLRARLKFIVREMATTQFTSEEESAVLAQVRALYPEPRPSKASLRADLKKHRLIG